LRPLRAINRIPSKYTWSRDDYDESITSN
jgi:hypothetical protein